MKTISSDREQTGLSLSSTYQISVLFAYPRELIPVQFSCSVMSDSLWPHGLQHTRLPCPSPTLGACSNSCLSSWWCHPTISSSIIHFSSWLQSFPASGSFPISSSYQVAKVLEFQLQHQSLQWYSGLISFRMDWLDLLTVQGTLKNLLQHHSSKASTLWHCFLYSPTLTSIYDYWKNHSFDCMDLCCQSDVSAF